MDLLVPKRWRERGGPTTGLGIKKTKLVDLTLSTEDGEEPHLHLTISEGIWEFKTDYLNLLQTLHTCLTD